MALAFIALMFLQAAGGAAQRPPASNDDLPQWSKVPNAEEMVRAYPAAAAKANLAGSGIIECTVASDGALKDCVVADENPTGQGFGQAAVSVAPMFTLPTKSPSGASTVGRTVKVPIRWLNPAKTQAPAIIVYDDSGQAGQVAFNCRVTAEKKFDNCVAIDAKPRGTNLFGRAGEAALRQKAPANAKADSRMMVVVEIKANNLSTGR